MAWQQAGGDPDDGASLRGLLVLIAQPRVGLRPGRIEPRALKRRPKPFPLLTEPRPLAQDRVRQHGHPKKQRQNSPHYPSLTDGVDETGFGVRVELFW